MANMSMIENRKEYYRKCKCGRDHENKFIRGMFKYSDEDETAFCLAMLEHQNERHIWLSFITGEWPNTNQEDCAVTCHIYTNEKGRVFTIQNGEDSPFSNDDIFDCYQVTREQVLAVNGAKEWFIDTYLSLFKTDEEIGNYLVAENA
jgi:hypothetical protein